MIDPKRYLRRWRNGIIAFLLLASTTMLLTQLISSSFALSTDQVDTPSVQMRTAFIFSSTLEEELTDKRAQLLQLEASVFSPSPYIDAPEPLQREEQEEIEAGLISLGHLLQQVRSLQLEVDDMVRRFQQYVELAEEELRMDENSRAAHRLYAYVQDAYQESLLIQDAVVQLSEKIERMARQFEVALERRAAPPSGGGGGYGSGGYGGVGEVPHEIGELPPVEGELPAEEELYQPPKQRDPSLPVEELPPGDGESESAFPPREVEAPEEGERPGELLPPIKEEPHVEDLPLEEHREEGQTDEERERLQSIVEEMEQEASIEEASIEEEFRERGEVE